MASDLMAAYYAGLTGRQHTGPDTPLPELLGALVSVAGSGAAAARLVGVSPTTFYRWRSGRQRPKVSGLALAQLVRRAQLPPARERAIRRGDLRMVIVGRVRKDSPGTGKSDVRLRDLAVGRYIPPRKSATVLNHWLAGNDKAAEKLMWKHVDEHYAPGLALDSVEEVKFEKE